MTPSPSTVSFYLPIHFLIFKHIMLKIPLERYVAEVDGAGFLNVRSLSSSSLCFEFAAKNYMFATIWWDIDWRQVILNACLL
mmetsp:Transcript_13111/g.15972  ORF Transcript_13111/g.15972 Transcript_13111/m.15972 type:complete len:82 (-) Transcript_13111:37-282(-)